MQLYIVVIERGVMKNTISIALIVSVFIIFASYGNQNPQWKGTIEVEDGVKVIKNPKNPIYENDVLLLEEELSIGESVGQPEYTFGRIAAVEVDENGCIYVADDKEIQVKVFDENGTFLRSIGSSGQGPGEIGRLYNIFINSNDELIITDGANYRLHFYSLQGTFLRDKSFGSRFPEQTDLSPQGQLYVLSFGGSFRAGNYWELSKLDEDLNVEAILHRVDIQPGPLKESLGDKVPLFCVRDDGSLVMGFAKHDEYRIMVINPQGNTSLIITRTFDPIPIPREILDKIKQSRPPDWKIDIPTHFAAFSRLFSDNEGRIYALTLPVSKDNKSYLWDVFDKEGRYLAEIKLPGSQWHLSNMKKAMLWKEGKLYTVEENVDGYHIVKRYRVTWKI